MKTGLSQLAIGVLLGTAIVATIAVDSRASHEANEPAPTARVSISSAQYDCLKGLFEREVVANGD